MQGFGSIAILFVLRHSPRQSAQGRGIPSAHHKSRWTMPTRDSRTVERVFHAEQVAHGGVDRVCESTTLDKPGPEDRAVIFQDFN